METKLPLIVITGPTASGKTSLAVSVAKKIGGEIISADSRTIYKSMNIGTAKPSNNEMEGITHWGIDLIEPDDTFTAYDFKIYAVSKIEEIRRRGHIPILVGGSGLYIDSVIFDYSFTKNINRQEREIFEDKSLIELYDYCAKHNIELPTNFKNKRYVINKILNKDSSPKKNLNLIQSCIVVGISTDKHYLKSRIQKRSRSMFDSGVVEETMSLGKKYGWHVESMTSNIYPLIKMYIDKKITYEQLIQKSVTADWKLAKRQLTWLKRNHFIKWNSVELTEQYILDALDQVRNS